MSRLNLWVAALLSSSALCAATSLAQAQDSTSGSSSSSEVEELGPVTIKAASDEVSADDKPYVTPAAVEWLNSQEIETFRSAETLNDALRSLPGVFTWQDGQQPGIGVNIRGLEGFGRVNMTIDGVRQSFRSVGHQASGYTYIDPNLLAGIEVQKGAVSTAGGSGALVGTVDFRTIGAGDVLDAGDTWGAQTTQMLGTNGYTWSGMASGAVRSTMGGALYDSSIFGAVSGASSGDYEDGDGNTVPYTGEGLVSGLMKLNLAPTEEHSLQVSGMWYNNNFSANSYNQNIENNTYVLNYAYTPDNNPWVDLRVNGYLNDLTMQYDGAITTGSYGDRQIEDLGIGFDISNTSTFNVDALGISLDYGVEYFHDKVTTEDGGVNPTGNEGIGGVFGQATFSYSIVDFIVGLRYDAYHIDGESATQTPPSGITPPASGTTDLDQSEGKVSPKFTLAVSPLQWLQLYGTYEWTFRPPTPSEALFGGVHPQGTGSPVVFYPNPYLEPERGKGFEFGANVLYDGLFLENDGLQLKVDYYNTNIDNYITTVCQDAFLPGPPYFAMGCWFANVAGTSNISGVELAANYDAGFAYAGISYTHANSDLPTGDGVEGAGEVSYLPDNYFTIDFGVRVLDEKLVLGARVNDVSEALVNDNTGETSEGYTTFDVYGSYQALDQLGFFFTATNITNVQYTPALSQNAAAGRTIVVGGTLSF